MIQSEEVNVRGTKGTLSKQINSWPYMSVLFLKLRTITVSDEKEVF